MGACTFSNPDGIFPADLQEAGSGEPLLFFTEAFGGPGILFLLPQTEIIHGPKDDVVEKPPAYHQKKFDYLFF